MSLSLLGHRRSDRLIPFFRPIYYLKYILTAMLLINFQHTYIPTTHELLGYEHLGDNYFSNLSKVKKAVDFLASISLRHATSEPARCIVYGRSVPPGPPSGLNALLTRSPRWGSHRPLRFFVHSAKIIRRQGRTQNFLKWGPEQKLLYMMGSRGSWGNAKTFEFGHKKMGKGTPGIIPVGVF